MLGIIEHLCSHSEKEVMSRAKANKFECFKELEVISSNKSNNCVVLVIRSSILSFRRMESGKSSFVW